MSYGNYNSGDDTKIKGDDGSDDGVVISALDDSGTKRLAVDAVVQISPAPKQNIIYKTVNLLNGSSKNMAVDGDPTPVNFDFTPGTGEEWYIESISIFIFDPGIMSPTDFGAITGLTNGLELRVRSVGTEYVVWNIKDNIDLATTFPDGRIGDTAGFLDDDDIYYATYKFNNPMVVKNSNSDYIRAVVQDDIDAVSSLQMRITMWRLI